MTKRNANQLKTQLRQLGFEDAGKWIDDFRTLKQEKFSAYSNTEKGNDQLLYEIRMEQKDNYVRLKEYELMVRTIVIPDTAIKDINTKALEGRMRKADELYNQYLDGKYDNSLNQLIEKSDYELKRLFHSNAEGREIAQQLMFRYWPDKQYKEFIPDDNPFKQRYEVAVTVEIANGKSLTALETYQYVKEMNREHVIADELLFVAKTEIARGNEFIAYNTINYFLDKPDMYFFKSKDEANEFSDNNISEYDNFKVIHAVSVDELLKQIPYGEQLRIQLLTSKNETMNEQNLKYLQDNIKYHGFGEGLNPELENQLAKGSAEFSLAFKTEVNKKEIEATLHFKKSDTTDMYFFNKYDSKVKNERNEDMAQTFYINKGSGVTLKEAYNLLNGRAVHKELTNKEDQKYKAWIQLDFSTKDKHGNYERKQYHENYGFDLKEALSFYPIKDMMKEEDMKALVRSLEKGNVQMVTLDTPGKEIKVFIEANPQYKSINVYDNRMNLLQREQKEELMKKPDMKEDKDQSKDQKQSLGQEDKAEKKQGKGKKAGDDGENNGLVKKKNNNQSKGMGVH